MPCSGWKLWTELTSSPTGIERRMFSWHQRFDALLELPFLLSQHKGGREKLPGQQCDGYKPRWPIFDERSELCADPSRSECLIFGLCASLFFMKYRNIPQAKVGSEDGGSERKWRMERGP